MNTLLLLGVILLVLMVLIGGKKGIRSFLSLFLNFGVLFFTMFFMMDPAANPIVITLIASTLIGCINLFFINEVNRKTVTAFISTMLTITILLLLIVVVAHLMMIKGFGEEEADAIAGLSLLVGVDFLKIGVSVIIMSTIGAVMDVSISIASAMHEMARHNPTISKKDLFASGVRIGRDILSTDTNTLFFAFFGGYLALLIWFKDLKYSIGEIINSKVFGSEMVLILCAGTGIAMVIPLTAWINMYYLDRTRRKAVQVKEEIK